MLSLSRLSRIVMMVAAALALSGCGGSDSSPTSPAGGVKVNPGVRFGQEPGVIPVPVPPLNLAAPEPPSAEVNGVDLRTTDPESLLTQANSLIGRGEYGRALPLFYWAVERGKTGQYNLACCYARQKQTDAALYWLQKAGLDEGVDPDQIDRGDDLEPLRTDVRWLRLRKYLDHCRAYWEKNGTARDVLLLPTGYEKSRPITVIVWLHGLGGSPKDFVNEDSQKYAERMKVAILGVSGTVPRGPKRYSWADDPWRDGRRIKAALAEVADRVTVKPGHLIALGFSQGAQVGIEIAVRNPDLYAGAILLSPGGESHLSDAKRSPELERRAFVLCCGAEEQPRNVILTANDATWLTAAKARVIHIPYPNMKTHAFPPDFDERFPEWVRLIEEMRGE